MRIEKDFKEFIGLLNENKVKYLVVGGFAVSYYSRPRYTKYIDIYIEASHENSNPCFFISKEDLIENKRAAARHQDIADVNVLEKVPSP